MNIFFRCFILTALIFTGSALAESITVLKHFFRNGTPDRIAEMVTERINRKITFQDTNDLIELLECHDNIPKINSSVETCDLAVIILSRISGISAVQRDTEVKAIISHLKDKEVFRYHIIKMNESELKTFRKKIKSWASKKFPA